MQIARLRGKLKKGGAANLEAAARLVLTEWTNGKLRYYCLPPKVLRRPFATGAEPIQSGSQLRCPEIRPVQAVIIAVGLDFLRIGLNSKMSFKRRT